MVTKAQILTEATGYLSETGLRIAIDPEIATAVAQRLGVDATAIDANWESPEAFQTDVLRSLAHQVQGEPSRTDEDTLLMTWSYLNMSTDQMQTPDGRRALLIDLMRAAADHNLSAVTGSTSWRNYVALATAGTGSSTADAIVLDALKEAEQAFIARMSAFYENALTVLGFQLKPHFKGDWAPLVVTLAAIIEGLGVVKNTARDVVERHFIVEDDTTESQWSLVALAFSGVIESFLELTPTFDLDAAITRIQQAAAARQQ